MSKQQDVFAPAQAHPSTELAALIQAAREAQRVASEYHQRICQPAYEAFEADRDDIPHYVTTATVRGSDGLVSQLSTANDHQVRLARSAIFMAPPGDGPSGAKIDPPAYRELAEAVNRREAAFEELRQLYNIRAQNNRGDELLERSVDALKAIEEYPAASLDDLIAKLSEIEESSGEWSLERILTDLWRIKSCIGPKGTCGNPTLGK